MTVFLHQLLTMSDWVIHRQADFNQCSRFIHLCCLISLVWCGWNSLEPRCYALPCTNQDLSTSKSRCDDSYSVVYLRCQPTVNQFLFRPHPFLGSLARVIWCSTPIKQDLGLFFFDCRWFCREALMIEQLMILFRTLLTFQAFYPEFYLATRLIFILLQVIHIM